MYYKKTEKEIEEIFKKSKSERERIVRLIDESKEVLLSISQEDKKIKEQYAEINKTKKSLESEAVAIKHIVDEAKSSQPWLSRAISDYHELKDFKIATYLASKSKPAYVAAEQLRAIAKEKKEYLRQLKEAEYKIAYYEGLFPELTDYVDEENEDSNIDNVDAEGDEVMQYVSKVEYSKLSTTNRNQLALDRYLSRRHSKSHIGKMYERYIGYLHETRGFNVEYFGIKKGLEDMGRDLICRNDSETRIIQCKCWGHDKVIHENVICQLYGTTIKYKLDRSPASKGMLFDTEEVIPTFVSNIKLSERATDFASALGVKISNIALDKEYPMIKCNINAGNKIYHLPFDQMYDLTYIRNKGECYVKTVEEAEKIGFRRAIRHII